MAGALLRSGTLRDFSPLGAVGSPVYGSASQLRAAMRRQRDLGAYVADMFAIPMENARGDAIDWYAPVEGDIVPWSAASPEERAQAKAKLLQAREKLGAKALELQRAADDTERQVFGRLLAQAMQIPGDEHVYLVAGRPVVTFWGFRAREAANNGDVISGLNTGEPGRPVPPIPEAPLPEPPIAAADEPAPVPVVRRSRLWWWLIPLLLLLLLLLLVGLKSCGVDVPLGDRLPVIPGLSEKTPEAVPPDASRDLRGTLEGPGVVVERDASGAVIGTDRSVTDVTRGPVEGTTTAPGDLQSPDQGLGDRAAAGSEDKEPQQGQGGQQPRPDEAGKLPSPQDAGKPPTPPVPPETRDQANQGKPPSPPESPSQRPRDAGSGSPLVIPQAAVRNGSTAFLDGQWRSMTGLRDRSGNPVVLNYSFKDGEGKVDLDRSVGGVSQKCAGRAMAAMSSGQLQINQQDVRCADGTTFTDSKVRCKVGDGGQAECRGINADGSDYDVRIVK